MRALTPFFLCIVAFGQPPKSPCDFDGFDINAKLAEVKTATTGYYQSLAMKLKPGDTVVVNRVEGDWTCGYLISRRGAAQGWVRSNDISPVDVDPNPPLTAWIGSWVQGENRVEIQVAKGKLDLRGEAYWHGIGDNVHTGEFSAEALPAGNKLHAEDDVCKIDLALIGKYILTNDNNMCGGANVRFWGVWKYAWK
ncbi:MAG TPA: hypothetical protein VMB25_06535 [Bryobacteraceae bacterium]|nr:hypothetical protein [Bryobacteraceae bacterium]